MPTSITASDTVRFIDETARTILNEVITTEADGDLPWADHEGHILYMINEAVTKNILDFLFFDRSLSIDDVHQVLPMIRHLITARCYQLYLCPNLTGEEV